VLIVEPSRNLIHLSENSVDSFSQPPWYNGSWTTVYVDSFAVPNNSREFVIDAYTSGPYLLIFIRNSEQNHISFHVFPQVKSVLEYSLLQNLGQNVQYDLRDRIPTRISIQEKVSMIFDSVNSNVSASLPEIDAKTREKLSLIASHQSTIFYSLFPLFLDDEVEEIYLDAPKTCFYFDHSRLGRVHTDLKPSDEELTRLVTLLRSESNLHLDRRNPSLKTDLLIGNTPLRFSVSLPPLASEGIHLEIRRARARPFTILDLIRNNTLSIDAAAMLILAINSRMNITITGSPGVGKTTLMNTLDCVTPKNWRKIYIEDAIESRRYEGHHQIRVRVDPVDEISTSFDKVTEIVKSLHRSPDYLILGEIQTEEHSNALFHSIAAGLCSIQTCHSATPYGLVTRWTRNHGIDESSVAMMDLIVSLTRPRPGESSRFVHEIVEIKRSTKSGVISFDGLNSVYNRLNPSVSKKWAKDGAFFQSAQKQGIESHIPAFESIVSELSEQVVNGKDALSDIVSVLWSNGHPMITDKI
jgi:type IV secretory pathway ATPase VirB11/archaellum biosynthesis ATPase